MFGRVLLLALVFAGLCTLFIGRLAQLQLVRGEDYAAQAFEARFRVEVVPARRGRIIDRTGTVIADNRTVFNLAVVLQDLASDRRSRATTPIWRLDSEALNQLAGDVGREVGRPLSVVRQQLIDEFLLNPGVALRQGPREEDLQLGLLAVPRTVLLDTDDQGEPAVDQGWDTLAASGILHLDPRQAVMREYTLRQGTSLTLFDQRQWQQLIGTLANHFNIREESCAEIMAPFAPYVSMEDFPRDGQQLRWRLLAEDHRLRAEEALARFAGHPLREVRAQIGELLLLQRDVVVQTPWLFVPSAQIGAFARHVPSGAPVREIALSGALPVRERHYLIQGESPAQRGEGMYQLLLHRLIASLDIPAHLGSDWLAAVIERRGERLAVRRSEREYRLHHLVLDADAVRRHSHGLSRHLAGSSQPLSPLALEQRLTQARRLADRDWRGQTRYDPLVVVDDVEIAVANRVAGLGSAAPPALARHFEESGAAIPGLRVVTDIGREYPYPGHASHLIGYLGRLSSVYDHSTAVAMGLDPQGWLGRSGLEAEYDELLQGSNGRRAYLRTPQGLRLVEEVSPNPGVDIHLTLDMELQRLAERSCLRWHDLAVELGLNTPRMDAAAARVNHQRAAMVLMDVNDGAILALASSPGYNLYDVRSRYRELADPQQNPGQPLTDHASTASHPPGSTVKPLVSLIALAEGATHANEVFFSRGYMARTAGGQPILREFQPFTPREFTHAESLSRSSNVVSATLAERVGPQVLSGWFHQFGFGRRHALDVGWQRPGILPSPQNLPQIRPQEPTWYPSDTWRAGIGQFSSASPLQLVAIPAAVANQGRIVRPYLWRDAPQGPPLDPPGLPISASDLRVVQRGMEMVTEAGGTATSLRLGGAASGIQVAAKTGTSEWGSPATRDHERAMRDPTMVWTPSHGWLIGYAPADKPQVAFAIFVYGGTSGGRAGTGIAKAVLEDYFTRYPPTP